jgi:hypothetical protein
LSGIENRQTHRFEGRAAPKTALAAAVLPRRASLFSCTSLGYSKRLGEERLLSQHKLPAPQQCDRQGQNWRDFTARDYPLSANLPTLSSLSFENRSDPQFKPRDKDRYGGLFS